MSWSKNKSFGGILQNNIVRYVLGTILILLIPLLERWPWSLSDFIIMGALILGTCFVYELAIKRLGTGYKIPIAIILLLVFLLIWIELAVGLFGTPFAGN